MIVHPSYLEFQSLERARCYAEAQDALERRALEMDTRELTTAELCRQFAAIDMVVCDELSLSRDVRSEPIPAWRRRFLGGAA